MKKIIEVDPGNNASIQNALWKLNTLIVTTEFKQLGYTDTYGEVQIEYINKLTGETLKNVNLENMELMYPGAEYVFFLLACQHEINHHLIESFCKKIIVIRHYYGIHCNLYTNNEVSFGLSPAYFIAIKNKTYIPIFIQMIKTFDLDHEVYEGCCIFNLIHAHGMCEEILPLVAARITTCIGQHGIEELALLQEKFNLDNYFSSPIIKEKMTDLLVAELKESYYQHLKKEALSRTPKTEKEIINIKTYAKEFRIDRVIAYITDDLSSDDWPNLSIIMGQVKLFFQSFE